MPRTDKDAESIYDQPCENFAPNTIQACGLHHIKIEDIMLFKALGLQAEALDG